MTTPVNHQDKQAEPLDNAQRQRQHVKRKQETHSRLQCWISQRHADRLAELGVRLEDNQASLIEQAIDLLYQHESAPVSAEMPHAELAECEPESA
ncbi:RepB family protein [Aeromonas rivuli]|uniref:RepB family protein n=1 Tax=Aeromonas rivuli TaxID=648794 RepID=UPI0005A94C34|nr:RepB family protein [Aeromonas rivuli]